MVDEKLDQCKENMRIAILLRDTNKQALHCGEDPMNQPLAHATQKVQHCYCLVEALQDQD